MPIQLIGNVNYPYIGNVWYKWYIQYGCTECWHILLCAYTRLISAFTILIIGSPVLVAGTLKKDSEDRESDKQGMYYLKLLHKL